MAVTEKPTALVNIECICSPDVHIGDGRVLVGPQREGTKVVTPGQVTAVSREIADFLVESGQVKETSREPTVFIEDTPDYRVAQVERMLSERRAASGDSLTAAQLVELLKQAAKQ